MLERDEQLTELVQSKANLHLSASADAHYQLARVFEHLEGQRQRPPLKTEVELNLLLDQGKMIAVEALDDVRDNPVDTCVGY